MIDRTTEIERLSRLRELEKSRMLHDDYIKALRWAVEELTGKIAPTEAAARQVGIVNVSDLINSLKLLDGKREIRFLDVANGDCGDDTSNIRGISLDEKGRYYIW